MWHHKVIQKAADIVSNIKIDGILPEPTKLELIKKSIYEICKAISRIETDLKTSH